MGETSRLQNWLAARKAADEPMPFQVARHPANAVRTRMQPTVLDDPHKAVLREILKRSTWPASDLRTITSRLGLMPWACVAKLNEWTTEKYGDLLLEGEDIVNINKNLAKRIQV